jgi:aspartate beta-hydroxylase
MEQTADVIRQLPEAHTHIFGLIYFSLLFPGVHVKSHFGPTNIRLRIHLGLDTPPGASFKVGNETRLWEKVSGLHCRMAQKKKRILCSI